MAKTYSKLENHLKDQLIFWNHRGIRKNTNPSFENRWIKVFDEKTEQITIVPMSEYVIGLHVYQEVHANGLPVPGWRGEFHELKEEEPKKVKKKKAEKNTGSPFKKKAENDGVEEKIDPKEKEVETETKKTEKESKPTK